MPLPTAAKEGSYVGESGWLRGCEKTCGPDGGGFEMIMSESCELCVWYLGLLLKGDWGLENHSECARWASESRDNLDMISSCGLVSTRCFVRRLARSCLLRSSSMSRLVFSSFCFL